eukprot:TRINITY_DN65373_c0_g1_i1.p1 TRINITY_DN65373_c0_g1~~TRINITY_DN65373_c0_g1_i1.p1  ORF type:complete len:447 (+),score=245.01 TRINITY_DN65373_c0_g1_i1:111-1343(+)
MAKHGGAATTQLSKLYRNGPGDYPSPEEFETFALQKMQEEQADLRTDNELLEEELETFRRYYKRQQDVRQQDTGGHDDLTTITTGDGGYSAEAGLSPYIDSTAATASRSAPRGGRQQRARRQSSGQRDQYLSLDDKQHITNSELEQLKKDQEKEEKECEHRLEIIRACIEEAEVRINETRKESFDFNRDFSEKRICAEKLLKYFDEQLKEKERHTMKLAAKQQALKSQTRKHEHQLRQREDMGEVLAPIDFDQLKIENQQFLERIEQKNKELVKLKLMTGNTVQTMNILNEKLNKYTQEQVVLKREIQQKQEHLETLQKNIQQVVSERELAEKKNVALRLQHEAVKVPKVEDYIQQKAELYELQKAARNWSRKLEIAEGQKRVLIQQLQAVKRQEEESRKRPTLPFLTAH